MDSKFILKDKELYHSYTIARFYLEFKMFRLDLKSSVARNCSRLNLLKSDFADMHVR